MNSDAIVLSSEITSHYISKILELSDEISSIRNELTSLGQIVEINWSGESGRASNDVIDKFNEKFRDIDTSLSEAMSQLSVMSVVEE